MADGNGRPDPLTIACAAQNAGLLSALPPKTVGVCLVAFGARLDEHGELLLGAGPPRTIGMPGLPKPLISMIEAAVEDWAEAERRAADAHRLVTP